VTHSYLPVRNRPSGKEFWASLDMRTTRVSYTLPDDGRRVTALVRVEALVYPNGSVRAMLSPFLAVGWAKSKLEEADFHKFGRFFHRLAENTDLDILSEYGFEKNFAEQCRRSNTYYHCVEANSFIFKAMPFFILFGPLLEQ